MAFPLPSLPQLPKVIIEAILASIFMYYLSSFTRDFGTFLAITMSLMILGITSASYGFMWGCMFGNGLGGEMSTPIDLYQMVVSGIYVNVASIPAYLKYFSLFYYFTEAVTFQYWSDVEKIGEKKEF